MRQWVVRALVLTAAAGATVPVPVARQAERLSVRDAVALYARGDFSVAVSNLHVDGLTVAPFTRALDEWIAEAALAERARRRLIAAAFALDANWAASQTLLAPHRPR